MKRTYHRRKILTILVILVLISFGQTVIAQNIDSPSSVEYCDLVKNPEEYDGENVIIHATYRYGFEWQEMYCLGCATAPRTWLEIDSDNVTKKSRKALKRLPRDGATVNALFIGKFESSGGPFGDGAYRFRFMVREVSQIELVTKSSAAAPGLPDEARKKVCSRNH
jgi:hypothetical protein